jgi:hypothetical protein
VLALDEATPLSLLLSIVSDEPPESSDPLVPAEALDRADSLDSLNPVVSLEKTVELPPLVNTGLKLLTAEVWREISPELLPLLSLPDRPNWTSALG